MAYKNRTDPLRYQGRRVAGRNSTIYEAARAAYISKYLETTDGPSRKRCRAILERHGYIIRSSAGHPEALIYAPGSTANEVVSWRTLQGYVAGVQALDKLQRIKRGGSTTVDSYKPEQLRTKLFEAGFKLIQTEGGYIVQHYVFDSLTAGDAEHPLSLEEVAAFAGA